VALSRFCSIKNNFYHFFDINRNYTKNIGFEKSNPISAALLEDCLHFSPIGAQLPASALQWVVNGSRETVCKPCIVFIRMGMRFGCKQKRGWFAAASVNENCKSAGAATVQVSAFAIFPRRP
jgi:hypothetical protein